MDRTVGTQAVAVHAQTVPEVHEQQAEGLQTFSCSQGCRLSDCGLFALDVNIL